MCLKNVGPMHLAVTPSREALPAPRTPKEKFQMLVTGDIRLCNICIHGPHGGGTPPTF